MSNGLAGDSLNDLINAHVTIILGPFSGAKRHSRILNWEASFLKTRQSLQLILHHNVCAINEILGFIGLVWSSIAAKK